VATKAFFGFGGNKASAGDAAAAQYYICKCSEAEDCCCAPAELDLISMFQQTKTNHAVVTAVEAMLNH
jgi:hypothetical protein